MSIIFSFSLAVSITLLIAWGAFRFFCSQADRVSINRLTIIAIYFTSLLLPLTLLLPSGSSSAVSASASSVILQDVAIVAENNRFDIWGLLLTIWSAGTLVALILSVASVIRILAIIAGAEKREIDGRKVYVTANTRIAPFSFGNIIVINQIDIEDQADIILSHEKGHVRFHHTHDMLLAQALVILCWYNPAAWLLRKELKSIHEYQADRYVLDMGNDMHDYQLFLIMKAARSSFPAIGNNLNKSRLKKRIVMMQKSVSGSSSLRFGYAAPLVAMVLAALLLASPKVGAALNASASARFPESEPDTVIKDPQPKPGTRFVSPIPGLKITGMSTIKKISKDSLEKMDPAEIKSITVNRDNRTVDVTTKKGEQVQVDDIKIIGASTVKKEHEDAEKITPVVILNGQNESTSKDIIYVLEDKVITAEELKSISPDKIDNISVNKSGEKAIVSIKLKK